MRLQPVAEPSWIDRAGVSERNDAEWVRQDGERRRRAGSRGENGPLEERGVRTDGERGGEEECGCGGVAPEVTGAIDPRQIGFVADQGDEVAAGNTLKPRKPICGQREQPQREPPGGVARREHRNR